MLNTKQKISNRYHNKHTPETLMKGERYTEDKKVILTPRKREEMERGRINEHSEVEDSSTT